MQAIRVKGPGGPDVLEYVEMADPEPGPGEVRVRVEAAGLNFIDIYHRTGRYPLQFPVVPGLEAAGVVDATGPDVDDVAEGDRVAYAGEFGSYAQLITVPADRVVPVPSEMEPRLAAAAMLQGLTAHYLATSTFPLGPGHTALIHAGAGGLGQLLIQSAKRAGARVFTTVSTVEKAAIARDAGADEIIRYTEVDFADEVERLTDGGVDVVYDSVGKNTFDQSLECLRRRGYLVLCGESSGSVQPFDPQRLNRAGSLFLTRPTLAHYTADREELLQRTGDLFAWIAAGELKVSIDRSWPLAEAAAAHRYMEDRQTRGKVLLIP